MDEDSKLKTEPAAEAAPVAAEPVAVPAEAAITKPARKMNKLIMWAVAAIVVIAAGTYAALALMGDKGNPEQQVVSYVAKSTAIESGVLDFTVSLNDPATMDEALTLTGQAKLSSDGAEITASLNLLPVSVDLRLFTDTLYAKIDGLSTVASAFPDFAAFSDLLAAYDGAWIGLSFSDLASAGITQGSAVNLPSLSDSDIAALLDLLEQHPFFVATESSDNKVIGDLTLTKKYDITFDATEAKAFAQGLKDLNLASLAEFNLDYDSMIASFDSLDSSVAESGITMPTLTLWADADYIRHGELAFSFENGSSFSLQVTATSINEPVTIEVPTAQYGLLDVLSALMGETVTESDLLTQ